MSIVRPSGFLECESFSLSKSRRQRAPVHTHYLLDLESALFHLFTRLRLRTLLQTLCLYMCLHLRNVLLCEVVYLSIAVISVESLCNTSFSFSCFSSQWHLSATFPMTVNATNEMITLSATLDILRQLAARVVNVTLHHLTSFLLT